MTKNKFQLKREATYRQFIEAGMRCFIEKGYAATTLGEVAERTGHTKGAFYVHFPNKETLFLHIVRHRQQLRTGWTAIPELFNPADTTLEEVVAYTLKRLQELHGGADNWTLVVIDFYQQVKQDSRLRDTLAEIYQQWVREIEQFVRAMIDRGWVSPQKDSYQTAMQLLALSDGFIVNSTMFGRTDNQAIMQGMIRLLC